MTDKASQLVRDAKQFARNYGDFANGQEGAALTAVLRATSAWNDHDSERLAGIFTENGSYLIGDDQLQSRAQILEYFSSGFSGAYGTTRRTEESVHVQILSEDAAVVVTVGGITDDGEELTKENTVRSTWITQRVDGDWLVLSHQNSPIQQ